MENLCLSYSYIDTQKLYLLQTFISLQQELRMGYYITVIYMTVIIAIDDITYTL